jgi:hypothetical protein
VVGVPADEGDGGQVGRVAEGKEHLLQDLLGQVLDIEHHLRFHFLVIFK